MPGKTTLPEFEEQKRECLKVVSVSIPLKKQAAFYDALAILKCHHEDLFIQQVPLIVETIIEVVLRIRREAELQA